MEGLERKPRLGDGRFPRFGAFFLDIQFSEAVRIGELKLEFESWSEILVGVPKSVGDGQGIAHFISIKEVELSKDWPEGTASILQAEGLVNCFRNTLHGAMIVIFPIIASLAYYRGFGVFDVFLR